MRAFTEQPGTFEVSKEAACTFVRVQTRTLSFRALLSGGGDQVTTYVTHKHK